LKILILLCILQKVFFWFFNMSVKQKQYLREHNIPMLLDTLIQLTLDARPDDPYEFIAQKIAIEQQLRSAGRTMAPTIEGLSAPVTAAAPAAAPVGPPQPQETVLVVPDPPPQPAPESPTPQEGSPQEEQT
jgi:hypothetical protein